MKHEKKMKELKKFCICASVYVYIIISTMIETFTLNVEEMLNNIFIIIMYFGILLLTILEYLNYVNKKRVEQGLKTKYADIDNFELKKKITETIIYIGTVVLSMIVLIVATVTSSSEFNVLTNGLYIICLFCLLLYIIADHLNYIKKYREEQALKTKHADIEAVEQKIEE